MRKLISILILMLFIFCLIGCSDMNEKEKDNKPTGNVFSTVYVISEAIQYEKLELALFENELKIENGGNPYDYSYMKVIADITSPSGEKLEMPAFWYQDYDLTFNTNVKPSIGSINGVASTDQTEPQGLESVLPKGDPHYRVRFLPLESGEYNIIFKVYKYGTLISTEHETKIQVQKANEVYKGLIQVDKTNNQTFIYSLTNETYIPIGQNCAWYTSTTRKTEDYGVWFKNMAENNMNQTRVWLAPWGFSLHSGNSYNNFASRYSSLARLDKLVNYLEEYEIYTMLCLINHGQFSSTVNPTWNENPYNKANGGILDKASDFFSKEEAKAAYKNELLYLIARYSYSPYIMSWELFNEVDWCDSYAFLSLAYKSWHKEMGEFIKANDPYHHMVSTSYKGTDGNANGLDCMDFTSPHDYSYSNKNIISGVTATQTNLMNKYNKPVFFGELGLSGENGYQNYQQDPTGVVLHQSMWAGMMSGAGGAMNWWWDSLVHPYKLYNRFNGAGIFSKKLDLTGNDLERLQDLTVSISNSNINILGYRFDDRIYGYLFDKAWTFRNNSLIAKNNVTVSIPFKAGDYTLKLYDTTTGQLLKQSLVSSSGTLTFKLDSISYDIAFIIE